MTTAGSPDPLKPRVFVYIAFAVLFWGPLYVLVKHAGFGENTALIASGIGVVPLALLFIPLFRDLGKRLKSMKVGDVEIGFQETIESSLTGGTMEMVSVAVDTGREVVYGKAGMPEFINLVRKHITTPGKRLVISIDLRDGADVFIPMLYFQSRYLLNLFDLRAFLFLDSDNAAPEERIIGTIAPSWALNRIDHRFHGLDEAFNKVWNEHETLLQEGRIADFIRATWSAFQASAFFNNTIDQGSLTRETFRAIFAGHIERNILAHPLQEGDYDLLLRYLEPSAKHIILASQGTVINVRSVDRVARELARRVVVAALRKKPASG